MSRAKQQVIKGSVFDFPIQRIHNYQCRSNHLVSCTVYASNKLRNVQRTRSSHVSNLGTEPVPQVLPVLREEEYLAGSSSSIKQERDPRLRRQRPDKNRHNGTQINSSARRPLPQFKKNSYNLNQFDNQQRLGYLSSLLVTQVGCDCSPLVGTCPFLLFTVNPEFAFSLFKHPD